MSDEPAQKRKREAEDDAPSKDYVDIAKAHGLWFDDGNIVLVAERRPFKVHKGVLAAKSQVFRDMFSIPQPPKDASNESEYFEGVPIVRLTDAWKDVYSVLRSFYLPELYFKYNTVVSFSIVKPWLVLGAKYEIESLRSEGLIRLRSVFPSSYQQYLDSKALRSKFFGDPGRVMDVINIAQAQDLKDVLPAAFYECSLLSASRLVSGIGSEATPSLSPADFARLLIGQRKLIDSDIGFLNNWVVYTPAATCRLHPRCTHVVNVGLGCNWAEFTESAGKMLTVPPVITRHLNPGQLCAACDQKAREDVQNYCQKTWNNLGQFFGLKA